MNLTFIRVDDFHCKFCVSEPSTAITCDDFKGVTPLDFTVEGNVTISRVKRHFARILINFEQVGLIALSNVVFDLTKNGAIGVNRVQLGD